MPAVKQSDDQVTLRLERNVRLYPWYAASSNGLLWLPAFFLFFAQFLSLDDVIRLGAIYYLSVVICEVPSGMLSDRFGRRLTLLIASVCLMLAYGMFVTSDTFVPLAIGQFFLAAGIAFQSGSDTSLLHDSLQQLNRQDEYAHREAVAQRYAMVALALSCVAGGALGVIDLAWPYVASAVMAVLMFVLTFQLQEPTSNDASASAGALQQISVSLSYVKHPVLRWLLLFFMVSYALQHIPYEFYQPYIRLLDIPPLASLQQADLVPLVSGMIMAVSMSGGAIGTIFSMPLLARFGLTRLLLTGVFIELVVICFMALMLHPLILIPIMLRNFPMSLVHGPLLGAIAPHVATAHRATYLSIQSLLGRLGLSVFLYSLAIGTTSSPVLEWSTLSGLLLNSAVWGLLFIVGLVFMARRLPES